MSTETLYDSFNNLIVEGGGGGGGVEEENNNKQGDFLEYFRTIT